MKPVATWTKCPGYDESNPMEHSRRDYCWACAPWWEKVPVCKKGHKLALSGYCKRCRKYSKIEEV